MTIIRWRQQARRIPLALFRTPIGWLMKRLAPPAFEPYPDQHGKTSFGRFFRDLWIEVRGLWLYLSPPYGGHVLQDCRPEARVAGTREHPVIAIAAGLMRRYPADADLVRVYLFHEFGHLASADLSLFAWTTSLNTACQVLTLSAAASSVAYALRFLNGDFLSALVLLVGILWLATLAITSLYLLRFAGVLISLRELQADIWGGEAAFRYRPL